MLIVLPIKNTNNNFGGCLFKITNLYNFFLKLDF